MSVAAASRGGDGLGGFAVGTAVAADESGLPAEGYARLQAVMARLRAADGCPWDREQSLRSLQPYLLEEAYELIEAIDALGEVGARDAAGLAASPALPAPALTAAFAEELGDVLLQVAFQAQIAAELGLFDAEAVARGIADKMVRRHPHVFGDERAADTGAVLARWQELKAAEGKGKGNAAGRTSVLDGVPAALPALLRAQRIGERAARVGFDWPSADGALAKVDEELGELRAALAEGDGDAIDRELGDALFALTSVARHAGVDAEGALRRTLQRFAGRFALVEAAAAGLDVRLGGAARMAALEALWQQAKVARAGAEAGHAAGST